jgi:uncharacterized protein (DUF1499 family)
MNETALTHAPRKPSISWVVTLGIALGILAALTLVSAPLGYRFGMVPLRTALLSMLRWGAYLAIGGAVVSAAGLIVTMRRPRPERRGAIVLGIALVAAPGRFRLGDPKPAIHDITTDTQDPPQYVAVLPLRANAPNTTVYGGEKIASQQRAAYPDIQPLILQVPPSEAFERALAAVRTMRWDLVAGDARAGRIEATDTTFWFRFKDDVVVRVAPADGGSRIDVRSLSRVGGGDAGTNAKRIREYLRNLKVK